VSDLGDGQSFFYRALIGSTGDGRCDACPPEIPSDAGF